ncbi:MAG: hypothetical protein JWQ41_96 [Variovorax sp.]|nr:hypothetical protein [Variovorax sp.]
MSTRNSPSKAESLRNPAVVAAVLVVGSVVGITTLFVQLLPDAPAWKFGLVDQPFWLAGGFLLFAALKRRGAGRVAMSLWGFGSILQIVFVACELWDGKSLGASSLSSGDLASIAGWSRLLAIECYVVALVLAGTIGRTDPILNAMRRLHDAPGDMEDKALFADRCRQEGLAVPQTLLESGGGKDGVTWHVSRDQLDRDLLCKPRSGSNSLGNLIFRRIAPNLYRDPEGDQVDLDTVLAWVDAYSRTTPVIVQPRLRTSPELADLADHSLVTARVLTCLDSENRPFPTHAFLRIPGGREPGWRGKAQYFVPIDLENGSLGAMTNDLSKSFARRFGRSPVTGQAVEDRVLRAWPAIQALALKAHRAFPQRILVSWDIALTDEGPLLLAGSISPDVMFPQRRDRERIALSPLGSLLQHHVAVRHGGGNLD